MLNNRTVLITGGTGSFGNKFTEFALKNFDLKKIIIFSRDEYKQFEMSKIFPEEKYPIRYFLGDIRDKSRLLTAFEGVDYVIHAAALKQVPALEYNPFEAVKTNILGTQNIIETSISQAVKKVIVISTDKAVSPINLYGATKLAMEKVVIAANSYVGEKATSFSAVRYGNVVGSRGSVIPLYLRLVNEGNKELPVTDERMTRFWLTLQQGVQLVVLAIEKSIGGEIFIPKIPSMRIIDVAKAISGNGSYNVIGIRPGEKIHEALINKDEGRNTCDMGNHYIILPQFEIRESIVDFYKNIKRVPESFSYESNTNEIWLNENDLYPMINSIKESL